MGRAVTGVKPWTLTLDNENFTLASTIGTAKASTVETLRGEVGLLEGMSCRRGLIWSTLRIGFPGKTHRTLGGIPNAAAASLQQQVEVAIAGVKLRKQAEERKRQQEREEAERRRRQQELERQLDEELGKVQKWTSDVATAVKHEFRRRGWLSRDFRDAQAGLKPSGLEKAAWNSRGCCDGQGTT